MKRLLSLLLTALALTGCAEIDAWREPTPPPVARDDTAPVFHVEDGQVLTPSGQPFVARGINLQYGDSPALKYPSIAVIASVKANIVRLELRRNTTAQQLRTALDAFAAEKLPVMAMYWESDITCHTSGHILRRDFERLWLKRWRPVLQDPKYAPFLMLNLANEWGTSKGNYEAYIDTYTPLIARMRAAGYRQPIVIDAADCGQNAGSFLEARGRRLEAADPLHNLIVSVHAYAVPWNSDAKIDQNISDLQATGVPFLIGEFGDTQLDLPNNAVDHLHLMKAAQGAGVGWIAWSWKGNGGAAKILDISRSYGSADLTRRGGEIVNGPDGLQATAIPAF